jgi:hypothetical protein
MRKNIKDDTSLRDMANQVMSLVGEVAGHRFLHAYPFNAHRG